MSGIRIPSCETRDLPRLSESKLTLPKASSGDLSRHNHTYTVEGLSKETHRSPQRTTVLLLSILPRHTKRVLCRSRKQDPHSRHNPPHPLPSHRLALHRSNQLVRRHRHRTLRLPLCIRRLPQHPRSAPLNHVRNHNFLPPGLPFSLDRRRTRLFHPPSQFPFVTLAGR